MTTFEVYRFSLWFYKNSIRWSLPKKCITSLLILTFLKFNEKRNIIHAHRNLISQFVPYEKSKNGARDLQIFEEYVFYQVRKLVTGLQRKWWFSKSLKKSLYQWQLLKSIVSVFGFIKIQYGDRYQNLQMLQKRSARPSNFWRVCVLSSAKNGHWSAAKMVIFKNI